MNKTNTITPGTVCNPELFQFPPVKKRTVQASFNGGDVSSDGRLVLLRQTDRRIDLTKALAKILPDRRAPDRIEHPLASLLRQRIYGLAAGYQDLNDHDRLRHDPLWQTVAERDRPLASSPTLCRLENRADRQVPWAVHEVINSQFIGWFVQPPVELILDFDTTDDRVHGKQAGAFFHGYYGDYCFLPLYVFCGQQLLVAYLRPGNSDTARHAWAVLKLLVERLRRAWPKVRIIFRGDSGFCRWRMLRWCEAHELKSIVGVAQNARLLELARPLIEQAQSQFEQRQQKQRLFGEVWYGTQSWDRKRRVLVKPACASHADRAEHTDKGSNPRFVVTNLEGDARSLYDGVYCARGQMENRIKEQQLGLFADRTCLRATHRQASCSDWWANQFRLLLSSCAYVLLERLRALTLAGTELARAQVSTIRLKLLKIGAVVLRNTRRVRLLLSSSCPYQAIFSQVVKGLGSG